MVKKKKVYLSHFDSIRFHIPIVTDSSLRVCVVWHFRTFRYVPNTDCNCFLSMDFCTDKI